ncbi:MAG: uroporphyrinogen-III synthase [Actinomycetales bacterium]|nr:uroporphyrinogen-III synthase [Actinomycetales bacterium]
MSGADVSSAAPSAAASPVTSPVTTAGFAGRRILIPRDGSWGDNVSSLVRELGGVPVVVPLVKFAPPGDPGELVSALEAIESSEYDWVTITSVATVGVLSGEEVFVPSTTQLAAVGTATGDALEDAGFHVSLTPSGHVANAQALATELISLLADEPARILVLQSDLASPALAEVLTDAGHDVTAVIAYRTIPVEANAVTDDVLLATGIDAALLTSGSIAAALLARFPSLVSAEAGNSDSRNQAPVTLASIGRGTTAFAEHLGMTVVVTAEAQNVEALVASLAHYFESNSEQKIGSSEKESNV